MAKTLALRWLARREYGRAELERKLQARGVPGPAARATVAALAARGLQSDDRYAQALAAARRRRGYGPLRVLAELRAAGLDDGVLAAAVQPDDPLWAEACRAWHARHHGAAPEDAAARAAQVRALRRRGYTSAQVRAALQAEAASG